MTAENGGPIPTFHRKKGWATHTTRGARVGDRCLFKGAKSVELFHPYLKLVFRGLPCTQNPPKLTGVNTSQGSAVAPKKIQYIISVAVWIYGAGFVLPPGFSHRDPIFSRKHTTQIIELLNPTKQNPRISTPPKSSAQQHHPLGDFSTNSRWSSVRSIRRWIQDAGGHNPSNSLRKPQISLGFWCSTRISGPNQTQIDR